MGATVAGSKGFVGEICGLPGGEAILTCVQCGTCTGACPNADRMDYTPSQIIAMVRAGLKEEVLASRAIWYCLSCYLCTVRCPRGVSQTRLMHALGYLAMKEGLASRQTATPAMYRVFSHYARAGSLPELWFMLRFYLKTNPLRALHLIPVAWGLLRRGRLSLRTRRLSPAARKQLDSILQKAIAIRGKE
ncbi:MAG: 4Fe-4S dicluster domain-containing protein [Dehalococcoidales bacterium]|nr:4Fe-4S dicluster domain-containing protein [Dehalococcoidales bacterium]